MANPIDDLGGQAEALKAQVAEAQAAAKERDANGQPTTAALLAQDGLPKLQSEYRQILTALATASRSTPAAKRPLVLNGTAYTEDPTNPGNLIPMPGAPAPGTPTPGTAASLINAQTGQDKLDVSKQNADTARAAEQARADYYKAQGDRITFANAASAYAMQLNRMQALQQIDERQKAALLAAYKAEGERAQAERRLEIEQQNANTTAGNLGVNRGQLGVSQQNADTQREQVIQSASSNAVDQTLRLLSQYTKVGPGFGSQFAAGLNTLSKGGGAINFTPDAFMNPYVPDLDAIRHSAVNDAIDRLKGGMGMAPATAAAVNATAVPGAIAPAAVPPAPSQAPGPGLTAAGVASQIGAPPILPGAPPAPPPVVPPYTGPVGQGGPGAPPQI